MPSDRPTPETPEQYMDAIVNAMGDMIRAAEQREREEAADRAAREAMCIFRDAWSEVRKAGVKDTTPPEALLERMPGWGARVRRAALRERKGE